MAKSKSTKSSSATIGFEQQIWDAACELWGHIPAADYRKIFTGLIFLKYISTAFEKNTPSLLQKETDSKMTATHTKQKAFSLFRQKHVGVKLQKPPTHQKSAQSWIKP